ncbi:MAG: SCP2 sterol-binding domain-containing protein [Lysobacteraceae bacterium]
MAAVAPSIFDTFKPLAGQALEAALNRLIALDPETQDALRLLEGRRIQLTMEAPALALELIVRDGRLAVGPADTTNEPDLAVRSTLSGLLSQIPFLRPSSGAGTGKMKIAGDAGLARQLQKLAERFDPDWNLPFTKVFGDVIGVQVASVVRTALRTGRDGVVQLAKHGAEFLTEESRDVIDRAELEAHLDDVDALRDRVERLAARMQNLQSKLAKVDAPPADASGTKP